MESVLLSVLSVLAALGEVRPLERMSSLLGEARPSGLAVCFLRPLRRVDICGKTKFNRDDISNISQPPYLKQCQSKPGLSLCSLLPRTPGKTTATGSEGENRGIDAHRASVPSGPHAMLPTESILFLFDGFEHKWRRVQRLLDGGQLTVLLEVDAAVRAQQDVLPAPVVPVLGG